MNAIAANRTPAAEVARVLEKVPKKLLIGGKWLDAASGKTFSTTDPATGETLAEIAEADAVDVDAAVAAAQKAFPKWRRENPHAREAILRRLADLIESHAEEIALLESLDVGKPLSDAKAIDVPATLAVYRYYAGWPTKIYGETNPSGGNMVSFTLREPVGVCGAITPWNFPLLLESFKLGAALATGNTIILKPAEQTPLSALYVGQLMLEAGFPEGVVNVLPGFGETAGAAMVRHPGIDKIAFTGSTEVGKIIVREAASTLKRVSLELGGKSPNLVFPDAPQEHAVVGSLQGVFWNAGQVCFAASRLFVQESHYEEFADRLATMAKSMKVGDPLAAGTQMGPLVSAEQRDRVARYIDVATREGAEIRAGGTVSTGAGYFVEPTVLTGVRNDMRIAQEEVFGPVVSMIPFKDEAEAIELANRTEYGLAAGVWTSDLRRAHQVASALRAGTVWVNCYNAVDPIAPFGGFKASGTGRELGRQSLDLYTEVKSVFLNLR
jgi:aldehyde dehydrogenase (NAD+)